jgi:hypothetical protein
MVVVLRAGVAAALVTLVAGLAADLTGVVLAADLAGAALVADFLVGAALATDLAGAALGVRVVVALAGVALAGVVLAAVFLASRPSVACRWPACRETVRPAASPTGPR